MKLRKIKSLCTLAVTVTICAGIFAGCGGASEGEKDASKPLVYNIGAIVETRTSDGSFQEAVISKLTDASWYTVGK